MYMHIYTQGATSCSPPPALQTVGRWKARQKQTQHIEKIKAKKALGTSPGKFWKVLGDFWRVLGSKRPLG